MNDDVTIYVHIYNMLLTSITIFRLDPFSQSVIYISVHIEYSISKQDLEVHSAINGKLFLEGFGEQYTNLEAK